MSLGRVISSLTEFLDRVPSRAHFSMFDGSRWRSYQGVHDVRAYYDNDGDNWLLACRRAPVRPVSWLLAIARIAQDGLEAGGMDTNVGATERKVLPNNEGGVLVYEGRDCSVSMHRFDGGIVVQIQTEPDTAENAGYFYSCARVPVFFEQADKPPPGPSNSIIRSTNPLPPPSDVSR